MKRPICEDDLMAFVDGALDEERRVDVEKFLESNPEAMSQVFAYRSQSAMLRNALEHVSNEPVPTRLNIRNIVEGRRKKAWSTWQVAAAATVFLAIGATSGWITRDLMSTPSAGIGALAMEASASYRAFAADVVRPVEFRSEAPADIASLASTIIGAPTAVPDLSSDGFRLMGGRVIPTTHGSGFMWMYDNDRGTRLVMMTRRMDVDRDSSMKSTSRGDINAWSWSKAGVGYSIVGSESPDTLKTIADAANRQLVAI